MMCEESKNAKVECNRKNQSKKELKTLAMCTIVTRSNSLFAGFDGRKEFIGSRMFGP